MGIEQLSEIIIEWEKETGIKEQDFIGIAFPKKEESSTA